MVDIGETSYAMVLADDLNGNGQLDLLLATMNGNLYAFQTTAPADPDATWPAQVHLPVCLHIHARQTAHHHVNGSFLFPVYSELCTIPIMHRPQFC